ncbi:tail completion protein gp17 [Variovorax boronicumulans]|uniref:tail completion protein gp17 n=1 Tax=Variovorax boronicumulans TaxID=436515 RepID=UPI00278B512C|nr:DUF3168 domain-containing protein [Variovorax boronicumulans]MDQ0040819.1 hypothetical protein [Variovorax boronicumulans]
MTVEADLHTLLNGLAAGGAYPDVADEGAVTPYIVYQEITGTSIQYLERALPSKKNGRYQVAVWADTRKDAAAIALQIENAMLLTTLFQVELIGGRTADRDAVTKLRGSRQDFSIWSNR